MNMDNRYIYLKLNVILLRELAYFGLNKCENNMFNNFKWKEHLNARSNVLFLIKNYLPYSLNFFQKRKHINDAQSLIDELETNLDMQDSEVYLTVKIYRSELPNDTGDFKKRLDFAVAKLEKTHPDLAAFQIG
jgi:hypothetical protein